MMKKFVRFAKWVVSRSGCRYPTLECAENRGSARLKFDIDTLIGLLLTFPFFSGVYTRRGRRGCDMKYRKIKLIYTAGKVESARDGSLCITLIFPKLIPNLINFNRKYLKAAEIRNSTSMINIFKLPTLSYTVYVVYT